MAKPEDLATRELLWRRRLLPLMGGMLAGLTVFFFVASLVQLFYLHSRIKDAPQIEARELQTDLSGQTSSVGEQMQFYQLRLAATLESNMVARRYHQANVAMMSRVWTHYLGFVTGMMLALVGSAFVLGRLNDPPSDLQSSGGGWSFTLRTASPGLVLSVLGVLLMIVTIVTHHEIQTQDIPVYFGKDFRPSINLTPSPSSPGR